MTSYIKQADGGNTLDYQLAESVRDLIMQGATIRIWGHALSVEAHDGVVVLLGHVRTRPSKITAEQVARKAPGVREVDNQLIVDTDLEIAVAKALAQDPRTVKGFPGVLVGSAFGEVFLKGCAPTEDLKKAATLVAEGVPGVREVTNELVAPEPPKPAAPAKPAPKPVAKPAPKPPAEESEESSGEES